MHIVDLTGRMIQVFVGVCVWGGEGGGTIHFDRKANCCDWPIYVIIITSVLLVVTSRIYCCSVFAAVIM